MCVSRLRVWGYFKSNLLQQTGAALVRCRYLNPAGFLSQTSDFPHTFPPLKLQKKMSKRQQSLSGEKRGGQTEPLFLTPQCQLAPGLALEPAPCQPWSSWAVKTAPCLFLQKVQLLRPLQNQLDFYFCFLTLASDRARAQRLYTTPYETVNYTSFLLLMFKQNTIGLPISSKTVIDRNHAICQIKAYILFFNMDIKISG